MKNLFPGYFRPTDMAFKDLWAHGTFIFDTNVLLRLYSYPEDIRSTFYDVLGKIHTRIWIPYHVALEFNRNRLLTIKKTRSNVDKILSSLNEAKDILLPEIEKLELNKRCHRPCDINSEIDQARAILEKLARSVKNAADNLPSISLDDDIAHRISHLFSGKIGSPPKNQDDLDTLLIDADSRYKNLIPPGFEDEKKGGCFYDRNIRYERKYGDLIIWKQAISHATHKKIKKIIFITGDRKKDWWWNEDGRTLGPLPELYQELQLTANIESFWIYNIEQFLTHAEKHLSIPSVTEETLTNIRTIEDNIRIHSLEDDIGFIKSLYINKMHNEEDISHYILNSISPWHNHYINESTNFITSKKIWEKVLAGVKNWIEEKLPNYAVTIDGRHILSASNETYRIKFYAFQTHNTSIQGLLSEITKGIMNAKQDHDSGAYDSSFGVIFIASGGLKTSHLSSAASAILPIYKDISIDISLIIGKMENGNFEALFCKSPYIE